MAYAHNEVVAILFSVISSAVPVDTILVTIIYVLIVNGPIILQKLLFQGKWLRAGKFNFCT